MATPLPAAAGAAGGLGGLLLGGGLSFLPSLLSGLGLFGEDPQAKLRKQIQGLLNPAYQQRLIQQLYQQALSSPAYSQAQGSIAQGANVASGRLASSLGARGIGTTGTGAILSSLTPSLVGSQMGGLRTGAYQSAQQQAMDQIRAQIEALTGTAGPSQTRQFAGAGLEAFGPILQQYLSGKFPGTFGTR